MVFTTHVYKYDGSQTLPIDGCVMALGFFDGVHLAHRDLIDRGRAEANRLGLPLGIFTFPTEGGLKAGTKRLYSTDERLVLLEEAGADFTAVIDFASVMTLTPEEFVSEVLMDRLKCRVAVIGFNFRFGRGASGDAEALTRLMRERGGDCIVLDEMKIDGETVCTTLIRSLLAEGEMERAGSLLGAPYRISGRVERGNGVGKGLGFPTVNIPIAPYRVAMRHGVYMTAISVDGVLYKGITNVGTCPTFEERLPHIEGYILDFDGDLYDKDAVVYFLRFMRDETRFDSPEALKMQINIDINTAINENGDKIWQELGLK